MALPRSLVPSVLFVLVVLLLAACGGSSDEAVDTTAVTTTTTTTTTEATTTTTVPPTTTTPGPDGIHELIDDYLASWETKDEAALRATVADGFVIHEYIYSAGTGDLREVIDDDADGVVSEGFGYDWENEIIGDSVVSTAWFVTSVEPATGGGLVSS